MLFCSVNVEVFSSEECNSAGDALRFMQEMEVCGGCCFQLVVGM